MMYDNINGVSLAAILNVSQWFKPTAVNGLVPTLDFSSLIQNFLNDIQDLRQSTTGRIESTGKYDYSLTENAGSPSKSANTIIKKDLDAFIEQISARYGLDQGLVKAVIKQESGFNPNAISSAGALGMMQLMPATARELGVDNPMDPIQNITGGVKYLRRLIDQFKDINKAIAAYNAGPGFVEKNDTANYPTETKNYVRNVLMYKSSFDNRA